MTYTPPPEKNPVYAQLLLAVITLEDTRYETLAAKLGKTKHAVTAMVSKTSRSIGVQENKAFFKTETLPRKTKGRPEVKVRIDWQGLTEELQKILGVQGWELFPSKKTEMILKKWVQTTCNPAWGKQDAIFTIYDIFTAFIVAVITAKTRQIPQGLRQACLSWVRHQFANNPLMLAPELDVLYAP